MALGQTIKGEIVAGFGGYYRIGKCMPVKVHLENSGRDLAGEVVIQISRTSFAQAVSLPSPSRKTYLFYIVPPKYFHELEVKLFTDGRLLRVFNCVVNRVFDEELLVIKSSTLKSVLVPSDLVSVPARKEKVVLLDPVDFPESWNDYDAVNSVVLDTSDTTRLSESQRTALSHWTSLGGRVTLINRDRTTIKSGDSAKAASLRTTFGLGSFGDAENSENSNPTAHRYSLMDLDEEIFKAIRIRESLSRTGIIWSLGAFLFLYGFAVVLCLHLSKRLGIKKLWNFAAIPAIAILFSAVCPWIGRIANAGGVLVRQNSVVHVFFNSADAFITNDLSLLLPRKVIYKLRPAVPSSYLVQGESENTAAAIRYDFEGKGVPSAAFQLGLGRTKLLSLASFSNQGLFLALRYAEDIALANRSAFPLRDCSLIRDGISAPVGDIPAGREFRLKLESMASDADIPTSRKYDSGMLSKTVDVYLGETPAGMTGDCVICEMAGSIPSLISDNIGLSYAGSSIVVFHLGRLTEEESRLDKK